jgi:uncharacterized protein DUF397
MTTEPRWRKSTYSNPDGDCLEIDGSIASIRDSKNPEVEIRIGRRAVTAFIAKLTPDRARN